MIFIKVKGANSILEKSIGLIGKRKPYPLLISTRFGIHTFGVKFSIDVIVLNGENKVVIIKQGLKPCRFFFWNIKYNKVLELPYGTVKNKNICFGSKISC